MPHPFSVEDVDRGPIKIWCRICLGIKDKMETCPQCNGKGYEIVELIGHPWPEE